MKKIEKSLKRAPISIISLIALMSMSIALNAEVLAEECSQNNLLLAKTENQIRYDGIYQADAGKGKWYYLRFYPKGKVLRVRCGTSIPPTKIVHLFLRKKYSRLMATSKPVVIGWYKVNGSDIEFRLDRGKGLYMGKFNDYGDSLTLSWFDSNQQKKISTTYWLLKGDTYSQRPEPLKQKKENEKAALLAKKEREKRLSKESESQKLAMEQKKDRKTDEQLVKGENVTEITKYDQYGLYNTVLLTNKTGEPVAKKLIMRSPYNPTQITGEIIRDVTADKDIHYTEVEGTAKNPMWICLDKDGNIIKRAGNPVLVKPFQAIQKTEFNIKYHGAFKNKKYTIFYPCSNCASKTGIKDCVYVW